MASVRAKVPMKPITSLRAKRGILMRQDDDRQRLQPGGRSDEYEASQG